MIFQKQFQDNFTIDSENISADTIFTMSGYRDTKTMVEEFILAGKKLDSCRQLQYDYSDDVDIDNVKMNPLQNKDFDMVDAENILNELEEKQSVIHGNYPQSEQATNIEGASEETVGKPVENAEQSENV